MINADSIANLKDTRFSEALVFLVSKNQIPVRQTELNDSYPSIFPRATCPHSSKSSQHLAFVYLTQSKQLQSTLFLMQSMTQALQLESCQHAHSNDALHIFPIKTISKSLQFSPRLYCIRMKCGICRNVYSMYKNMLP